MAPKKTKSERNLVKSSTVNIANTVTIVIQAWRLKPQKRKESVSIFSCLYKLEDVAETRDLEDGADVFVNAFNIDKSALFLRILQYVKEDTQTG